MAFQFTKYQIILAIVLVISGSINTIAVKWMDLIVAIGRDGIPRRFIHPFIAADFMFVGECLCLLAFFIILKRLTARKDGSENSHSLTKGSRSFKRLMLIPPAIMDITATSIMYFGLTLTNASSFQMLRGSVIVFVAIISIFVLKRKLSLREWIGITVIILALIIVGVADTMSSKNKDAEILTTTEASGTSSATNDNSGGGGGGGGGEEATDAPSAEEKKDEAAAEEEAARRRKRAVKSKGVKQTMDILGGRDDDSNIILGDVLIIVAQLVSACQMVYEEVFLEKMEIPPLQMVGLEGVFGLLILSFFLIPLSAIPNIEALQHTNANGHLEDVLDAFSKIGNRPLLIVPILALMLSIAFYNYSGISLTKELNATTRMVLDSIRILVIWVIALALGWQKFHYLQIIGFLLLMIGMCVYNNIIIDKIMAKCSKKK